MLLTNGIVVASIVAVVLNLFFNGMHGETKSEVQKLIKN